MARLSHPAIAPLYDSGIWSSGEPYFATRHVEGTDLAAVPAAPAALLPHVIRAAAGRAGGTRRATRRAGIEKAMARDPAARYRR